jgi:phospholipase C
VPQITRRRLLQSLGAAGTAAFAAEFLPSNVRRALASGPPRGGSLRDIKHVVILMQENRSFDHYFGTLPNVRGFSDSNAITLSTGNSVFYQPVQTSTPTGTAQYSNPDGYLLPFHLDTKTTSAQAQPSTSHSRSVTVSPDGSEVWAGNGYSGSVSIIAAATNAVVATVGGGPGTSTLDAAITDIAFTPAP